MKLERAICMIPDNETVTVADYLTGEIYVDNKKPSDIIHGNDAQLHRYNGVGLKDYRIYRIETGKVFGDLKIGRAHV